jgi:hypothetical protein
MNREQLIRICINSGVVHRAAAINLIEIIENNTMEDINKLVEAEREACAKVCESQLEEGECPERAQYCADAIRARGKQ